MPFRCHVCGSGGANEVEDRFMITECPDCDAPFTECNWASDHYILHRRIPVSLEDLECFSEEKESGKYSFREIVIIKNSKNNYAPEQENITAEIRNMREEGWKFISYLTPTDKFSDDEYFIVTELWSKRNF